MARSRYDDALRTLREAGANLRCADVKSLLEGLGFEVHDGNSGNHKTYTHDHIANFFGADHDCGHGRNPEVKRGYIGRIKRVVELYEDEIRTYLGE